MTPRDLAGDIWWEKLSQTQKEAQHGTWTTGYADSTGPMACWDCGVVQEADLERFHCFICGGRGALRLGEARSSTDLVSSPWSGLFECIKGKWTAPIRYEMMNQLKDFAQALRQHKKRLKQDTSVSVPLILPSSTLLVFHRGNVDLSGMSESMDSVQTDQWILKGDLCSTCGRFVATTASILRTGVGVLRVCVHQGSGDPLVKKEWSKRTSWGCGSQSLPGGVPVRLQGTHIPPEMSLPASGIRSCRSWMQQFAPHQPERHDPGAETMVDILTLQIGGGTEKVEVVRDWMVGVAPSVALLQELWDLELKHVDWARKYHVVEGEKGQGLGLAVLIERYLLSPDDNVWTLLNEEYALVVAFIAADGKLWAVGSIHLRPGSSVTEKKMQLRETALACQVVRPDALFLGGDFNGTFEGERSPLRQFTAGSRTWTSLGLRYVGDPAQITNQVKRGGKVSETAIDHGFAGGHFRDCERHLIPGVGSHFAQLFTARIPGLFVRPFGWKRYPWRRTVDRDRVALMDAMEVYWYWAAIGGAEPDQFLGVYHHVADQLIYRDPTGVRNQFLKRLRSEEDTSGLLACKRRALAAKEELLELGVKIPDKEESENVGITSATRTHMRLTRASLTVFGGIKGHPEESYVDVEEELREISRQAEENNLYRGELLQLDILEEAYRKPLCRERCVDRPPDELWIAMRRRRLNREDHHDRNLFAEELIAEGSCTMRRLCKVLRRPMTDATAMDLLPSSQLKQGGMVARHCMLNIMEQLSVGIASMFNSVAHYGIRKKEPYYYLSGYRHIFVETSLSRVNTALDHSLLSDVCELTRLWGPNLFSYRKGFNPAQMAIILRRCAYKILEIHGEIWLLDWDETGAFPKLQLQNLDALLRMAANWRRVDGQPGIYTVGHPEEEDGVSQEEAVWFCQDRFDQFYRRQVIYPVTEHGLGEPYGAADGLLEGDSAAPAVYFSQCSEDPVQSRV